MTANAEAAGLDGLGANIEEYQDQVVIAELEPLRLRRVGSAMLGALVGEQTHGKEVKEELEDELLTLIEENPHYQGDSQEGDSDLLARKLLRFRPRLVGAVGAYAHLSGNSYKEIVEQNGLESFYLFWALGSIQDDFIDTIPKRPTGEVDFAERRSLIGQSIFGDDRRFYRAAHHQLRDHIRAAELGDEETKYALGKISDWYRFLVDQEAQVLDTPFEELTFDFCRKYREEQNMLAGSTLVALLNGNKSLDPRYQKIEPAVAKFSFLTQIIDDIADTAEDLTAERPSYAVGALVDNSGELATMQDYIGANPNTKVTPAQFKKLAPSAYDEIAETFQGYSRELRDATGSKGMAQIGGAMFNYFPYIRNVLYKIDPKYANF